MSTSSKENSGKKPFSKKSGFTKYRKSSYGHRPYYQSGNHIASFKKKNSLSQLSTSNPYSSKNVVGDANPKEGPYFGWKLYFPGECYEKNSIMDNKLRSIIKYFLKNGNSFKMEDIESMRYFTVDAKSVSTDTDLQSNWPDMIADLRNLPEQVINYFGLSMHQIISIEREKTIVKLLISSGLDSSSENIVPMIHARFVNYEPVLPLKNLKSNAYGKFISVKGTVVRVSNIKPLCLKLAFKCNICNSTQVIIQPQGRYCVPSKCPTKNCSSHSFQPLQSSSFTETVDSQNIRLQETMVDGEREGGRVPRTVECELMEDLVNTCMPGDIVTLSGIVKINSTGEGKASSNKDKCMYLLYISTNSITSLKQNVQSCSAISAGFDFNLKDLYAVQAIEAEKHLFRLIVSSICPSIYGHEMVKAGLVLGLFGGRHKFHEEENHIPVRGDPHILIVGDPGLGKSQMLQSCSNIAPRGVYVCGNTTTSSGLTVTLSKETGGEYALEAGALVLADQGCCCIDEFDKMNSQHHALLEAMEQQTISIAKGGIVCSLPARTSILAAANPVGGHYNKAKTVSENLKLGSALLSRFDLVFIMLDKPDEELDCKLSEHIMSMHSEKNPLKLVVKGQKNDLSASVFQASFQPCGNDLTIKEKLKFKPDEECDHIPHQLLRKYIAYARKYVHPQLSPEAAHVLQQFYLDLRKHHQSSNSTPITTRQLESLIRLTEARARLELRENCTADDAQDVVDIMKYSMCDTYSDEYGLLDFQRSLNGSGTSFRSRSKKFISALTKVAERMGNKFFSVQHMKQIARDVGIEIIGFEEFISSLNNQGFLIKKGPKLYHLQTI